MKITWLGHATVVFETADGCLITDPVLRDRVLHLRRHSASVKAPDHVDAVLMSHLHHDHLDTPSLRGIEAPVIGPRGTRRTLRSRADVTDMRPGQTTSVADMEVTAVRAVHDGRRWHLARRHDDDTLGFVVEADGARAYFAGDTELYDEMRELRPLDVALVPIWGWGTKLGPGHMDPAQAAAAVALLAPATVIPVHYGTFFPVHAYRRHSHLLTEPAAQFRAACAELAPDVQVEVVEPGSSYVIPARPRAD
jgi:L-ascorbate metabolism protein UlaG (beta-lactamase superfamily)